MPCSCTPCLALAPSAHGDAANPGLSCRTPLAINDAALDLVMSAGQHVVICAQLMAAKSYSLSCVMRRLICCCTLSQQAVAVVFLTRRGHQLPRSSAQETKKAIKVSTVTSDIFQAVVGQLSLLVPLYFTISALQSAFFGQRSIHKAHTAWMMTTLSKLAREKKGAQLDWTEDFNVLM